MQATKCKMEIRYNQSIIEGERGQEINLKEANRRVK
jgi:hypothetical protein